MSIKEISVTDLWHMSDKEGLILQGCGGNPQDFVPNQLGGFENETKKPNCPLIGQDSNIFNLLGIAASTLRKNGQRDAAKEMQSRAFAAHGYDEALGIIGEYVNITAVDEDMDEDWDEDWDEDMEGGMDY